MEPKNIEPAILIETSEELLKMVTDLTHCEMIGVDTESNSLFEYEERICLIQFSSNKMDYLVDSIKLQDLSPLNTLFSNSKIQKIFHAAEYDLMCLKRDYSFVFKNIFDTMIASRILGLKSYGLSSLLEEYFHISVDKKYQRANWGKRPLSKEMLMYAQLDTHFLIELRNILSKELIDKDKMDLANEDFKRISDVEAFVNNKNNDHYWRIIKGNSLTSQQESVLIELYYLRENLAKQLNRPPFKVFSNQMIIEISKKLPNDLSDLKKIDHFPQKLVQKFGEKIINAVKEGSGKNCTKRKQKAKPNPNYLRKYDALKKWRKVKGSELSVDSDIVLPKEHLEQLAHLKTYTLEDVKSVMKNIPYRFNKFGFEILTIMENEEG
jgi:ribonuclease D